MKPSGLEARIQDLVSQVKDIDMQLSQTRRYDPDGSEWSHARYHKWRHSALYAKRQLEKELAPLRAALKEERRARHLLTSAPASLEAASDSPDPVLLFAHAYRLLRRLASEGVDLDATEQAVVNAMESWLHHGNLEEFRSLMRPPKS